MLVANYITNVLKRKKIQKLICAVSIAFGTLICQQNVLANLSLAPIYLQLEANKTQTTGSLTVGNTSEQPTRVRISKIAFTYDDNGNFIEQEQGGQWDLSPYLQISPKEITIPPKSNRNIRFAAIIPPSLPDGEYRVAIFAETLSQRNVEQQGQAYQLDFLTRIGSAIYVKKGEIEPNLKIEKALFNTNKKELRLTILNQGTATAKAQINWQLSKNNQEIIKGTGGASFLPQKTVNALLKPENKEQLNLEAGTYQLSGELTWKDRDEKKLPFSVNLEVK